MKAIETKYLPATARKGSRIVASDSDGNRATISYPHELSGEACHLEAARQLCLKKEWFGRLVGGETKRGWVFVFIGEDESTTDIQNLGRKGAA